MSGPMQRFRGGMQRVGEKDRTAFAQEVLEVLGRHGDVASEACWQELSQVVAQYWMVFQTDQSPLSTWGMIAKCTETILKIRAWSGRQKSDGSGADALEEFRRFMGEVVGDETPEPPER